MSPAEVVKRAVVDAKVPRRCRFGRLFGQCDHYLGALELCEALAEDAAPAGVLVVRQCGGAVEAIGGEGHGGWVPGRDVVFWK